jgi:hypothetical protein
MSDDGLTGKVIGLLGIPLVVLIFAVLAIVVTIAYWQLFAIVFVIVIYETLISLDLSGSLHTIAQALANTTGNNSALVSLVPDPKPNKSTQSFLFKLDSPFKMLIQINRAILYFAFFIFLMASPFVNVFFNMPSSIEAYSFIFINNIILLEIPLLSVFLLLAIISSFVDIIQIMVS